MTTAEVFDILHQALRRANDPRINDVTTDESSDGRNQIVLTTDDGETWQTWTLDEGSIAETDSL